MYDTTCLSVHTVFFRLVALKKSVCDKLHEPFQCESTVQMNHLSEHVVVVEFIKKNENNSEEK